MPDHAHTHPPWALYQRQQLQTIAHPLACPRSHQPCLASVSSQLTGDQQISQLILVAQAAVAYGSQQSLIVHLLCAACRLNNAQSNVGVLQAVQPTAFFGASHGLSASLFAQDSPDCAAAWCIPWHADYMDSVVLGGAAGVAQGAGHPGLVWHEDNVKHLGNEMQTSAGGPALKLLDHPCSDCSGPCRGAVSDW